MIKRISLFLLAMIALTGANAQLAVGTWRSFPVFSEKIDKIIETPDKVYYTTAGVLYCYDKDGDETTFFSDGNLLTDVDIKDIYYNPDKDYVAVVYAGGNIDLVYDRGHVVNLPEIKNAVTNEDKVINNISFGKNRMYVSTNFGLVIYDDVKHEVTQSGFYDKGVWCAVEAGDFLFISNDYVFYSIPSGDRINSLSNFTRILGEGWEFSEAFILDSEVHRVVARAAEGLFFFAGEPYDAAERKKLPEYKGCSSLISGKDGIYFTHNNNFYKIDSTGAITLVTSIPDPVKDNMYATWEGPGKSFWAADNNGIGNYKIADGSLTVLSDKFTPDNYITVNKVAKITPSSNGRGFYLYNIGASMYHPAANNDMITYIGLFCDKYEDGDAVDVTPVEDVSTKYSATAGWLKNRVGKNTVITPSFVIDDPDDNEIIYVGSGFEGVYVFKNGKEIAHFYKDNAPLDEPWGCRVFGGCIDKYGNLWVQHYNNSGNGFIMLPASKRKNIEKVSYNDWIACDFDGQGGGFDGSVLSCKKSNVILLNSTGFRTPLIVVDSSNSDMTDNIHYKNVLNFTDQDGNSFMPIYIQAMVEDNDGRVWLGTNDSGVLEISRPADAMNPNFTINRIKVPRNDGSNLADYLMGTEDVLDISVDASNRKWIATRNSGLYLVSPRGDEIISNFNKDNSPLPTNTINCVYADPNSNSVFIGTNYGLMEYSSDSSPARPDYSDVYAYPNPVTPEYTGWITIKGLMDNSLVKICDAGMNVIAQIQSEGGMALWDGCNHGGERVKSGVYYVLASQSDGNSSSAGDVVTKILVVN
ncbi:MAG: hypothetical protein K2L30_05540 [Duncaniella sp.]|nr:hypothetical protein [Duncaniella sp.]